MKRYSSPSVHVLAVAFVSVFVAESGAQEVAGSGLTIPQLHLALTNANVIDVRTGNVLDDATVVIQEGRIVAVGREAPPAGVEVMDLGGRFLLPGLMDGHVHFSDVDGARRAVESGATTVKSAAVGSYRDVALRDAVREGYLAGPDILAAGVFVSPTPNPNAGLADPRLFRLMRERVDTPERIRHLVRVNLEHGVDWIKTRSSERAGGPLTDPRELVYNQEQLGAMVEEAGMGGAPVECHVQGDVGAAPAIRAGVRMIEHGWYLSEDSLRLMKEHGTYWDPTTPALLDVTAPEHDYQSVVSQIRAPYMLANVRRNIKTAYEMGVKLVTGTDTSYGPNSVSRIATEITNFVEWGVPPLAALQAATIVSAEAYRLEDSTGAIEVGLEADLVAYDRNPLQDIWVVHDPTLVISNGRIALDRALVPEKPGRVPGDDD